MRLHRTVSEHCHCPSIHAAEDLALALVTATIVYDYFLISWDMEKEGGV
jgi:hypothetical protein